MYNKKHSVLRWRKVFISGNRYARLFLRRDDGLIHGHEVLNMMIESGEQYTHASLEAAIKARFGEQARFHTCSAEGMTAGELVAFLAAKGKFIPSKDGFSTDQSKICRH